MIIYSKMSDRKLTKYCKLQPSVMLANKYKVVSRLGKGRFSIVYLVEDASGRRFAVKIYRKGNSNKEYFDNELLIARLINENSFHEGSKYVVQYADAFAHLHVRDGLISIHPSIVYNLLGSPLSDLLDYVGGGLSMANVKKIAREVLMGVSFMHRLRLVHTDIKAENILLTRSLDDINGDGEISVVVADIGSSTYADNIFTRKIGTQEYLSPEAVMCYDFDTSTDVWSVMCLVYEMVTGGHLFDIDGADEDLMEGAVASGGYDTEESSGVSSGGDSDVEISATNKEYDTNRTHLALMESILGPMPIRMTRKSEFHNNRGRLKGNPKITHLSIRDTLARDFEDISEIDCLSVESFLLDGLKYLPEERPRADDLLAHPWLL